MPLNDFLQVDDIGIALVVTVTAQDGVTPINLSAAINPTIYILRPDQKLIVGGATFFTDGTDGKIQYITQSTDLTVQGVYKIQATYQFGGNIKHTEKSVFCMEPNLVGVS